ncbi:rhomboid family intramembrane serine protease [Syntrophobacter fumaroxidans]|uniref:Rhomboid family protein n=1 Tax=Syntrophobacter fumaroxidans (strain DSM 10017 / MPOB) TaxID=335543 RepID=A0LGP8_SYNFM|nr:rhomboid family intramembrane serine protease [Syntrophobacter fumaroxidans]ABK16600.1 Rhomboid family protein [Syntrophobacter fumaroxidans MPOB]
MDIQGRRSILCPNCRRLISTDETSCPHCGLSRPGSRWRNNLWTGNFFSSHQLVRTIIFINAGMFVLSLIIAPSSAGFSMNPLNFLSPGSRSLLLLGATGRIPIDQFDRWWTLLSASYLHGSILHILFNMMAFSQIAPLIVHEYGASRTLAIYTLSGIGGYVLSYFAGTAVTLGASAAVCGLIGAALYYGRSRGGQFGQLVYRQVSGWVIGLFIFGFLFPGIDNWAHGGGLLTGILAGFVLGYQERQPERLLHKTVGNLCVIATALTLVYAVGTSFLIIFRVGLG